MGVAGFLDLQDVELGHEVRIDAVVVVEEAVITIVSYVAVRA